MALINKINDPASESTKYTFQASALPYAQVLSTSTAAAFIATVQGVDVLADGVCVMLKNGRVDSATSGFTLDVNGLGAKPVRGKIKDTASFGINDTMMFVYDTTMVSGGCWVCENKPKEKNLYPGNGNVLIRNLPQMGGYTRLETVYNPSQNTYINTDVLPSDITDIELEIRFSNSYNGNVIPRLLGRMTGSSPKYWIGLVSSSSSTYVPNAYTIKLCVKDTNNGYLDSNVTITKDHVYTVRGVFNKNTGAASLYVLDETTGVENVVSDTLNANFKNHSIFLFPNTYQGSYMANGTHVYHVVIRKNGRTVVDYIPVERDSDNTVGFINTVNGEFVTATEGAFAAGQTSTDEDYTLSVEGIPTKTSDLINDSGFITQHQTLPVYTIAELSTPTSGYLKSYKLQKDGADIQGSEVINIPKDFLVKSGEVKTVTAADKEQGGIFYDNNDFAVGDKYIDFVVNTKTNDGTDSHIYINVKDLIDEYTAGNGITINGSTISAKVTQGNGLALDSTDGIKMNADSTPTVSSNNMVTSQGIKSYVDNLSIMPLGTEIISSSETPANLNSYTTPGNYAINTNAVAGTVLNIPEQYAGKLVVIRNLSSSGRIGQLFLTYNSHVWYRGRTSSWQTWRRLDYDVVSPIELNSNGAILHAASGPALIDTTAGDTTAQTPTWGGTFKALSATVNKYGHATALDEHTVTIPDAEFVGEDSLHTTGVKGLVPAPTDGGMLLTSDYNNAWQTPEGFGLAKTNDLTDNAVLISGYVPNELYNGTLFARSTNYESMEALYDNDSGNFTTFMFPIGCKIYCNIGNTIDSDTFVDMMKFYSSYHDLPLDINGANLNNFDNGDAVWLQVLLDSDQKYWRPVAIVGSSALQQKCFYINLGPYIGRTGTGQGADANHFMLEEENPLYFLSENGELWDWATYIANEKQPGIFGNLGYPGLVPDAHNALLGSYLCEDGTWSIPSGMTYSVFGGSGSGHSSGLVPDPGATSGTTKYLCEDGMWLVPPDTTYTTMSGSGSGHAGGLVPDPGATFGTTKYLCETGNWADIDVSNVYRRAKTDTGGTSGSEFPIDITKDNSIRRVFATGINSPGVYKAYVNLTIKNKGNATTDVAVALYGGYDTNDNATLALTPTIRETRTRIVNSDYDHIYLEAIFSVESVVSGKSIYYGYGVKNIGTSSSSNSDTITLVGSSTQGQSLKACQVGVYRIGNYVAGDTSNQPSSTDGAYNPSF